MKAHHKRIRVLRRLAVAGCLAGLAVPTAASAMLPPDVSSNPQQSAGQPYTLPSGYHPEVQLMTGKPFSPPSNFRTEVQTPAKAPSAPATVALRRFSPTPTVVHQFETVSDNSGRTLAIVLAAVAIAIALCSLAYSSLRIMQVERRELGSGSH